MSGIDRVIKPSAALPIGSSNVLSEEQVKQWRERGCLVVNNVFPKEIFDTVHEIARIVYPDGEGKLRDDFGSGGKLCFPIHEEGLTAANEIPLSLRMITAVSQLLGCREEELRLSQSDLWGKRAHTTDMMPYEPNCNADQRVHCDYPNHTLVVPPAWDAPEVVAAIVYFDHHTEKGGQTRVVPRQGAEDPAYKLGTGIGWRDYTTGSNGALEEGTNPLLLTPGARGDMIWINDKTHAEQYLREKHPEVFKFRNDHLYPREEIVGYEPGTVLFYRHDVWHRGTPLLPKATRRTQNLVYKRAGCDWVNYWSGGAARWMYEHTQCIERLIAGAHPFQRALLGFPPASSAYWTDSTLAAVKLRYGPLPGGLLHMEEIEAALKRRHSPTMPAEWAPHDATWMLWPFRTDNWYSNAQPAQHAFVGVIRAIAESERVCVGVDPAQFQSAAEKIFNGFSSGVLTARVAANITLVPMEYDDSWVRDSGPTFVYKGGKLGAVDWQFNAWGGKCANWTKDQTVARQIAGVVSIPPELTWSADFVLEGGSIHVDGEGTVLTTEECLLNPNRNPTLSKSDIEARLHRYLGTSKVIWLPRGLLNDEDTNGHIDNFACFTAPGKVLLAWSDDPSDEQYHISREAYAVLSAVTDAKGRSIEVTKMPIPTPMFYTETDCRSLAPSKSPSGEVVGYAREVGERLAGSYVNFYIANTVVVCPSFGQPVNDKAAKDVLAAAFPSRRVIQVPGRDILLGGGNIHCITQQQPAAEEYVSHFSITPRV